MLKNNRKFRISVDQSICVGAGLCASAINEVFAQRDEDGIVELLQVYPDQGLYEVAMLTARDCPSRAIRVEQVQDDPTARAD